MSLTETKLKFFTCILLILINFGKCANILGLMPVASPSHHIWNSVIMHALGERGHNVTVLSADIPKPSDKVPKNVHYIHLEEVYNSIYNSEEAFDLNEIINISPHKEIPMFYDFGLKLDEGVINSKGFKQLLNYPDNFKFDLIIFDYTFSSTILGFLHKFNYPPLVGVSAYINPPNTLDFTGGHFYPGYIPFISYNSDTEMNFLQRIYNTYLYIYDTVYRVIYLTNEVNNRLKKNFSNDKLDIFELEQKMVLALVNSHPSINYPQPLPPNVIEIAGSQIQDPQPLDKELEDFINKSKKGAILFSLGTNMKPNLVGQEKINSILDAIESFPDYHFLWKFDTKYIERKMPSNLIVRPFYQQRDVLAHPKIKLFITHSGGLSTSESTWRGVPMVGIPLFVDQHRNIYKSLLAGVAVKVDFSTMTTETLKSAIKEVLTNKSYAENMKIRSQRYRDRPMKPLETIIWWVEYVLRHPNPEHLKSPVLKVGHFIANCYDILILLILIVICICCIVFKNLKKIFFESKSKKTNENSNKKNN